MFSVRNMDVSFLGWVAVRVAVGVLFGVAVGVVGSL